MQTTFEDQHVVVTGGTGALGRAVVEALLQRGATCHIPVFDAGELERFDRGDDPRVHLTVGTDLRDERSVAAFYGSLPSLDASVHLAGGFAMTPLLETPLAQLEHLFAINVHTCFLACREAARRMREAGRGGRIVNVAAKPALVPMSGLAAYAASKSAVASLTVSLAEELAPEGIWVNAIVPSTMDTPANRAGMPDADFARWPKVEEVADAILALLSPDNRCMRGALVPVYGKS